MGDLYRPGLPARAKLCIASIDEPNNPEFELRAQYNPSELQIDKQIPWGDHKNREGQKEARQQNSPNQSDLEFNSAPQRTMQIALLFDGCEEGESIQPDVERLERLTSVRSFHESNGEIRRPHHCLIVWGAYQTDQPEGGEQGGMRPFRCVIESLSTKYTMWNTNGVPLRATCTIKVKEAEHLSRAPLDPRYEVKERPRSWLRVEGRPRDDPFSRPIPDPRSRR